MESLKQRLVEFFQEMMGKRQFFKRKLYEDAFQECYETYKGLFREIEEVCEAAEDKEAVLEELSTAIPAYVHGQIESQKRKSQKENLMIDFNMTMVTFVVPLIGYSRNEDCLALIDKMVEKWNSGPVTMKIGKSDYESLKGGFKSRLCYITTAVCESRHQPDDCYELRTLRNYRDEYLLNTLEGEAVVEEYYDVAPTIVHRINQKADSKKIYEEIYQNYLKECLTLIEEDKLEECREVYTGMVTDLKKKYLYS